MRTLCVAVLFLLPAVTTSCKTTRTTETSQTIVDSVARMHPDVTRLTVHCTKPNAPGPQVCASTAAHKIGRASDPEDIEAMRTGNTVVLDEGGALDVTVPILAHGGRCAAVCGVTLTPGGMTREQTVERAKSIAGTVEARIRAVNPDGCCCAK